MASIKDLKIAATSKMPVVHPGSGEILKMPDGREQYIELGSEDSPEFRRVMAENQDRNARALRKGRFRAAENERAAVEAVAAATHGWLLDDGEGGELPFSRETAKEYYTEYRWLFQQCDEWMAERKNYLGESLSA